MMLTGVQIIALADFADGDDCTVAKSTKGVMGNELTSYITVTRAEDKERVRIYENGMTEAVRGT